MRLLVTDTDVEAYRRDGFVVLRNVVPRTVLDALAAGVSKNMASPSEWMNDYTPKGVGGRFFDDYVSWQRIPEFREAALHGSLPHIAGALMQTDQPRFFHEHVLVKEPGTVTPTPWHHDDPYYGIDGLDNVSLWVPLDPVPEAIALRCVRGSHATGKRFIPNRFKDDSPYVTNAQGFTLMGDPERWWADPEVRVCAVEPGDVVAFHFRTLHAAPGTENHLARRRVVSFRYLGDDARWAQRPWTTSPPFPNSGLAPGDVPDEERFPTVALR
ncbi:MAG: phytanoyl-CoA dioxygenase [Ilumatobacteraceae bacterium]|nr:phytanoyl-CoA dioxygenase [Ilumatobacteraceae bacterium]